MKHAHLILAFIATLLISACGGGGGSSTPAATIVSGAVSKGPLNAATVCAYAITGGAKGAAIGTCATTDANGNYSIDLGTYAGPVLLEAAGGSYVDEATGATVALAKPLHSMQTNAAGSTSAAVTALTELAYKQASAVTGGLTNTNIQAAISNVQANFGVADIVNTQPVDALNLPATATAAQKTYALALAAISQYQQPAGTSLDSGLQEMLACLAAPLTGCGKGTASVGVRLNAALATFQAAHPAFLGMPSLMAKFGSQPTDSLVKYDTVTVAGLNRRKQKGTLVLSNGVGDTLSIQTDGTYTFATPLTAAARIHTLSVQPAGNACAFTKNRMDVIDPYTEQLISQNTAEVYCYESPCGSLVSLGQAPAPKELKVTTNPDSTVSFSWQKDAWANGYRIYYGTSPDVVTTDPVTGFAVFQNEVIGVNLPMTVPPNANYYYAITSEYWSPANLDPCQSSASVSVKATAPSPTITGMSPSTGAAGTTVTITGTNFSTTAASNTVKFNGTQATVTAATATSLTVTVPVGATTGAVSVTTTSGTATSAGNFTVSGGSTIALACNVPSANFCQEYSVANSSGCGVLQTVSSCAAANSTSVLVGTCKTTKITTYYYSGYPLSDAQSFCSMLNGTWSATGAVVAPTVIAPTISSFSPFSGMAMNSSLGIAGTKIYIYGSNFSATISGNTVKFNGVQATVIAATTTELTVTVPIGATTGPITVTTSGGTATSSGSFPVIDPGDILTMSVPYTGGVSSISYQVNTAPSTLGNQLFYEKYDMSWLSTSNYGHTISIIYSKEAQSEDITDFAMSGNGGSGQTNLGFTDLNGQHSGWTYGCHLSGPVVSVPNYNSSNQIINYLSTGFQTCASLGITFDRVKGTLSFASTPLIATNYGSTPFITTLTGTLRFTPF